VGEWELDIYLYNQQIYATILYVMYQGWSS
jgi:hypothetical protein